MNDLHDTQDMLDEFGTILGRLKDLRPSIEDPDLRKMALKKVDVLIEMVEYTFEEMKKDYEEMLTSALDELESLRGDPHSDE